MFRGSKMRDQERASGGPFLAPQTLTIILPFDREYLKNGKSQRYTVYVN